MRESRTAGMLTWCFGIVCVVFALCNVQIWGDSIIYHSVIDSRESKSLTADSTKNGSTPMHPLILEAMRTLRHTGSDNFIILESTKPTLRLAPRNAINQAPKNVGTPPSTPNAPKPKVLLIMDDLSTAAQLKSLENLSLNITPSIFPATKQNTKTPSLAASLAQKNKTYMLHLPLEAINFEQKELMPLKMGMSKESLRQALQKIRHDFPALVYINNHTGSKFTQSKADMENLLEVIDSLGFKFIDSVTTPHSASEIIAKQQGRLIMQRDVFLDNERKIADIQDQIQSLINKARKNGYAIGICHPHSSTFKALRLMQNEIAKNVDLVGPQELEAYLIEQNITQYKHHKHYVAQGNEHAPSP